MNKEGIFKQFKSRHQKYIEIAQLIVFFFSVLIVFIRLVYLKSLLMHETASAM
jgi:hypothetical protein